MAVKKLKSEEMNNPKVQIILFKHAFCILRHNLTYTYTGMRNYFPNHCRKCYTKKIKVFFSFSFKAEIMHEAEVMMKLDHPNIVRIIGTV